MNTNWKEVTLAEIAKSVTRPVKVVPGQPYRTIGVKWWGEGAYERQTIDGSQTAAKTLSLVREGDLIINKIWVRHGSTAIASTAVDGCAASGEFPTFSLDPSRVVPRWIHWQTKTRSFWEKCDALSRGTSGKNRIKPELFLTIRVPLPPFAEQVHLVEQIEELATQIQEARTLGQESAEEAEALFAASLRQACRGRITEYWRRVNPNIESARRLLDRIAKIQWPGHVTSRERKPMNLPPPPSVPPTWLVVEAGELQDCGAILDIQDGNHGSDYPRKAEFGDEGVPFVTAKQIEYGTARVAEAPKLPKERAERLRIGFAKAGDVLLTHNASVGDVAIAPANGGDFLLGTSVTYWRCNHEALEPRYLFYFMRSEYFQGQLQFIMKQTTRNQVSVLKQVNLWICFPPLTEQRQIVAELDALQAEVDKLKHLQTGTAAELDALMPSILDKAFRGEL